MNLLLLALFLVLSGCSSTEDRNTITNSAIGISITKPSDWQFTTQEEKVNHAQRLDEQALAAYINAHGPSPVIAISKHPEPFDGINPNFKINVRPLGASKGIDPKAILKQFTAHFSQRFNQLRIVQDPIDLSVSDLPGAYTRFHYALSPELKISSEIWAVPRGAFLFIIGAGTREDEQTGSRSETLAILESITIEP